MWKVYKFDPDQRKNVLVDTIENMPFDCFGDDLYEILEERGIIEDMDNFQVAPDTNGVALVSTREGADMDDYYLQFEGDRPFHYFMTIWQKNKPFMDAAAHRIAVLIRYTKHPDDDFICVETDDQSMVGSLMRWYKYHKTLNNS